jgi:hypothetical protein
MAYNVAANLRQTRPGAAYLEGRDGALRNALNERQMAGQEQAQAFSQQNALVQRERQARQDQAEAQQQAQAGETDKRKQAFNYLSHLAKSKSEQEFNYLADRMSQTPLFQELGIGRESLTPDEVARSLPMFAAQAGQGPAEDPVQYEQVQGPRGAVMQRDPRTGELKQVVGPDNSQPAAAGQSWRPLTPQEIAAAGLPPGTSAQTDGSGKIDVLSKRDATGGLSQKDMTTARQKLNTISIARRQLQNIKDRFGELQGSMSAGVFGQGKLPTPKGKAFDAAVDQMRSTLTALTRVPGVGAMSDYETRLDQAKFPSRQNYEAVTAQQIGYIEEFLNGVEGGYQNIMSGGAQAEPQQAGGQGGPVRVNTPEEAAALPSGTEFITPDGRRKVRP